MHTIRVLLPYDKLGLAAPMRERGSVQVEEYRDCLLYTSQRRRVSLFLPTLARLRIPRRFRQGRYIRLWQSSSRRWEPEIGRAHV